MLKKKKKKKKKEIKTFGFYVKNLNKYLKEDIDNDAFFVEKVMFFLFLATKKVDISHYDMSVIYSCPCHFNTFLLCLKRLINCTSKILNTAIQMVPQSPVL